MPKEPLSNMGFIFHVGLYSFYGYDDITAARKRKSETQNGSEFYLERLQERSYRPISGSKETKIHHVRYGNNFDYFQAPFYISKNSICQWLDLCVKCRASHVIITAKHHDGYCLWNTGTTDKKSSNDIVMIFKEEAEKRNLLFGIYYSWYEFLTPMTIDFFSNVCIPQINELLLYNPKILWFDGDWVIKQKGIISYIEKIIPYFKNNGIFVNDRITETNRHLASFRVGSDRSLPQVYSNNWQHVNTIGISWGYNRMQQHCDYKTGQQLYQLYSTVISLGGSLLLNIGPKSDGTLDENEIKSLDDFSKLIG